MRREKRMELMYCVELDLNSNKKALVGECHLTIL
jgi:hypothetical protein